MVCEWDSGDLNAGALKRCRTHPAMTGLTGRGVVICVVDYGFDLLHSAFRTERGLTRFAGLIDQNGETLERAEINRLLLKADAGDDRQVVDDIYDPHANYYGHAGVEVGAHGSWVASIAAGSRSGRFTGVAPDAVLVGVQLNLPDTAWREEDLDGRPTWLGHASGSDDGLLTWDGWRSYEDNPNLESAITSAHDFAARLNPDGIVLNLSIGAWAGGHDEGSSVNQAIASVAAAGNGGLSPMTAVIAATGNAGDDNGHIRGSISSDCPVEFDWWLDRRDTGQSKLEIWSDARNLDVDIVPHWENGETIAQFSRGTCGTRAISLDGVAIGIGQHRGVVRGGLSAVRLLMAPALIAGSGPIGFRIIVRTSDLTRRTVHAWIERESSGVPRSSLTLAETWAHECALRSTLTPLACAPGVISVAGLDNETNSALAVSGRGPRPWPDTNPLPSPALAAPAEGLYGAWCNC